jgi:hypothetical protein
MTTILRVLSICGLLLILNAQLSALPPGGAPFYCGGCEFDWNSAADVQLVYYNFCTGWAIWWGGWQEGERAAVVFDSGCQPGETTDLIDSRVFCYRGAPSSYGFTSTVSVHDVDPDGYPVDPPIDSKSWLPAEGNNEFVWNVPVGDRFAIVATFAAGVIPQVDNPTHLVTECPDFGSGWIPDACGVCYPASRPNHTFFWYNDQWHTLRISTDCDAQLLFDAGVNYAVGVSERTWGRIKALYR